MIRETCARLREKHPRFDPRLVEYLESLLSFELRDEAEMDFVLRLQQLTGPVMAKGVEDTTFYRYVRLIALNEVGGDPSVFHLAAADFHELMRHRQARSPEALNASSTHDTKRSEDVRARLLTLSEVPEQWRTAFTHWRKLLLEDGARDALIDAGTEYLLWQSLVGAWPIERERLQEYARKAAREAKLHTSWQRPNEAYEASLAAHVDRLYENDELCRSVQAFVDSLTPGFEANALAQTLLKVTCPGVPDVYQGTELYDFSLVDPDNRRPVDYPLRRELLSKLTWMDPAQIYEERASGLMKLYVLHEALGARRALPECFDARGAYTPLRAVGPRADRVIAFGRGEHVVSVVTLWWLLHGRDFRETSLVLPEGRWCNRFTRAQLQGTVGLDELLGTFPCALLLRSTAEAS
jgi:(1->4)-alpha-D-glucan 1-alpha-D-glucosylmutase